MRKRFSLVPYSEQQLAGLRTSTLTRKQETVTRLQTALEALKSNKRPITTQTIYQECGLYYASYARNPEALALFRANSTHLNQKWKARKNKHTKGVDSVPSPRDPLMNYKKPQLIIRVHEAERQLAEVTRQQAMLLAAQMEREAKIAELETRVAEIEPYRSFLEKVRIQARQEEHGDG